ncbi:hypothetical protein N658DRAFT_275938 [Parathielavia hyrcaniae]|uniref:Uncharacterized protein n=1 Tax=Parathielavia hyrcaniae TaxID=113614 RepID=A0AAN6Q4L1_9PEZI|nr:hypothetical protein N658DRAFT_275938 [Parathielavia hyrcaniae]
MSRTLVGSTASWLEELEWHLNWHDRYRNPEATRAAAASGIGQHRESSPDALRTWVLGCIWVGEDLEHPPTVHQQRCADLADLDGSSDLVEPLGASRKHPAEGTEPRLGHETQHTRVYVHGIANALWESLPQNRTSPGPRLRPEDPYDEWRHRKALDMSVVSMEVNYPGFRPACRYGPNTSPPTSDHRILTTRCDHNAGIWRT